MEMLLNKKYTSINTWQMQYYHTIINTADQFQGQDKDPHMGCTNHLLHYHLTTVNVQIIRHKITSLIDIYYTGQHDI